MAVDATSGPSGRPGPSLRLVRPSDGIRDDAERIVITTTDALAPWLECQSLADDIVATAERIVTAAFRGSRAAVINEANRLAYRAAVSREEARERIGLIEPIPERAA